MNNINEIKEMLDKLNEELENLRAENAELKLRLSKYEAVAENDNLNMTIEEMDLSNRSYNCLAKAGLKTAADILKCNAKRLHNIKNLGTLSRREVVEKMAELGFDDWASKMR